LKRVLACETATTELDEYCKSPDAYRRKLIYGLRGGVRDPLAQKIRIKKLVLCAVHGYDKLEESLNGDALAKLRVLVNEIDLLSSELFQNPRLSLLLHESSQAERVVRAEDEAFARDAPSMVDDKAVNRPQKKPKTKKGKKRYAPMFVLNEELSSIEA
jgi:hypothetical protein